MGYFAAASLVESQSTQSQKSLDETELYAYLQELNLDEMSPKDAMNALYEAKALMEE